MEKYSNIRKITKHVNSYYGKVIIDIKFQVLITINQCKVLMAYEIKNTYCK